MEQGAVGPKRLPRDARRQSVAQGQFCAKRLEAVMAVVVGKLKSLRVRNDRTGEWFDMPLADGVITGETAGPIVPARPKRQPKVARHWCRGCTARMTPAEWQRAPYCEYCRQPDPAEPPDVYP